MLDIEAEVFSLLYTSSSSALTISGSSLLLNDARDANFFMEHVGYGVTMPADFIESSSANNSRDCFRIVLQYCAGSKIK